MLDHPRSGLADSPFAMRIECMATSPQAFDSNVRID